MCGSGSGIMNGTTTLKWSSGSKPWRAVRSTKCSISFHASLRLERKERTDAGKMRRVYKEAQNPAPARALAAPRSLKAPRPRGARRNGPERLRAQSPDRPATAGDRGRAPTVPHRGSDLKRGQKQDSSASRVQTPSPGRLNNSSEPELPTLDILRGRELRLKARPLATRSSAAWAALAQEVSTRGNQTERCRAGTRRKNNEQQRSPAPGNTHFGATNPSNDRSLRVTVTFGARRRRRSPVLSKRLAWTRSVPTCPSAMRSHRTSNRPMPSEGICSSPNPGIAPKPARTCVFISHTGAGLSLRAGPNPPSPPG